MKIFRPRFQPYKNPNVIIEYTQKLPGKSAEELYYAQDVIGNYAKEKGVVVRFFGVDDPKMTLNSFPKLVEMWSSNLGIEVSKKSNALQKRVSGFVNCENTEKEPFLRQVYKTVEKLIKDLNG